MDRLPPSRAGGCALALGIGALTIVLANGIISLAGGMALNLAEEWPNFLAQLLFVALPFGLLALAGIKDGRVWLAGLILTAAFWGYYLSVGLRHQLGGERAGVDFRMIFVMLASPLIITMACFLLALALRKRS